MPSILQLILDIYHLIQTLWNAYLVLVQMIRSVVKEAQQEAIEFMDALDGSGSVMDAMTTALTDGSVRPWQMLIVSRDSSFVLLLRLSKTRVLQLEVDEAFVAAKLEVIKTELMLDIRHVPRMLRPSIGTHDTRVIKYVPTTVPFVWEERSEGPRVTAVANSSPVGKSGGQGGTQRKKYVQLLTAGTLRRRLHLGGLGDGRGENGSVSRKVLDVDKTVESKRRALADITIANVVESERDGEDKTAAESPPTPKQVRMERNMHAALTENLSIPNMVQATSVRNSKSLDNGSQSRRMAVTRRKHELYSRGSIRSFNFSTDEHTQ